MDDARVSLVRCNDYSRVYSGVEKSLTLLGGAKKFFRRGQRILLKPNISDPLPPEKAACTHPLFVKAVIELAKKSGAEVWVGEGSAGGMKDITKKSLEESGIGEVVREAGVNFRNFEEEAFIPREIPSFRILEKTDFAAAVFQADVVVNLPKLKTHGLTFMTGSIKNCFGCIHPIERQYLHGNFSARGSFSEGLVDIYSLIKPQLTIMDAVVGMEGDQGPSYGDPKKIGLILAGEDGVAVDAVAASVIGYNPSAIPTIKAADSRKVGVGDIARIRIIGEGLDEVKVRDFKLNSLFDNKYRKIQGFGESFIMVPELTKSKCVRCGTCASNCPVKAIQMNPYPTIDRERCIMCYCCHELCPKGAYQLKIKWLGKKRPK